MDAKILSQSVTKSQLMEQVESISRKNITENDFRLLDKLIIRIGDAVRSNELDKSDIAIINRSFGNEFLMNTLQGHALRKPQGYAGDYMIIDKIYTYHHSEIEKFKIWDKYAHTHSSLKAVRNRKKYFKSKMHHKIDNASDKLDLLNLASGPARDVKELYDEIDNKNKLLTTCVDLDSDALAFAKKLNSEHSSYIEFINANILRFKTEKKFDVVWSAGLFDYFNEKAFIMVLSRMKEWVKPGGEIIIGNFNERHNPSRDFMEIMGEWFLQHRTEEELVTLAMKAGYNFTQVNIGREPENVNLFLHIKC
ncbi:class I SAM-dependent methyltransferase [Saccharicrinis sp. FJH62]|uniref:class I SAM-dependent methyltransferase n=1 Tax=Saccharicrinis sp. FJH62 TaxID=3344657 RepID=UPI0035D506AF